MVIFSVIIATRNRAFLFERALNSVLNQTILSEGKVEIIVVDDGSNILEKSLYKKLIDNCISNIKLVQLPQRGLGHGPSFSRNEGVKEASGSFLCFLDDDDEWIDETHLESTFIDLSGFDSRKVLYLSNQIGIDKNGNSLSHNIWIEDLLVSNEALQKTTNVNVDFLLKSAGFCHLNCTIVSRELLIEVGGFDESLRYEEDRDLYFRLIENADTILFNPAKIANHYVPDQIKKNTASTSLNEWARLRNQVNSMTKLISITNNPTIHQSCITKLRYCFQKMADLSLLENKRSNAIIFSCQALSLKLSFSSVKVIFAALTGRKLK